MKLPSDPTLLSCAAIVRAAARIDAQMREASGYQPFGIDDITCRIVFPDAMLALDALKAEARRRLAAGCWVATSESTSAVSRGICSKAVRS